MARLFIFSPLPIADLSLAMALGFGSVFWFELLKKNSNISSKL
jgi:hypothetical protein